MRHECGRCRLRLSVVAAGLPHRPPVLSARKSYSARLFRDTRIDRRDRAAADRALTSPAREERVEFTLGALTEMFAAYIGAVTMIEPRSLTRSTSPPRLLTSPARIMPGPVVKEPPVPA